MNVLPLTAYTLSILSALAQSGDRASTDLSVRPVSVTGLEPSQPSLNQTTEQNQLPGPKVSSPETAAQPESTSDFAMPLRDMAEHPLESVVTALARQGIVKGFPDGSFRPDEAISPKDWLTLVQKATEKLTSESLRADLNLIHPSQRSLTRGKAAQLIYQALSQPANTSNWIARGDVLVSLGRNGEAAASYDRALSLQANNSHLWVQQCRTLLALDQPQRALAACDRAMNGDGHWGNRGPAEVWNQRGQALAALNRLEEALSASNRAIALASDNPEIWTNQAVIFWRMKRFEEALRASERAIVLNPNYPQGWFNQGRILRSLGQDQAAVTAYDRAIQALAGVSPAPNLPNLADIWINRSVALWKLGRYPEALKSADRAIGVQSNYAPSWYNRGVVLTAMKQPQVAVKSYQKAVELNPDADYAWTGQGIALEQLGHHEAAIAAFNQALKLNPSQKLAQQNLDTIKLKLEKQPKSVPQKQPQQPNQVSL